MTPAFIRKKARFKVVCLNPPPTKGTLTLKGIGKLIIALIVVLLLVPPNIVGIKQSTEITPSLILPPVKIPDWIYQDQGIVERILELQDGSLVIQAMVDGDLILYKISPLGLLVWSRSFPAFDYCTGFIQTHDDGFAFTVGTYEQNNFNEDSQDTYGILIKTNDEGEIEWQKTYVYEPFSEDNSYRLAGLLQSDDEGFILIKSATRNLVIQKTDVNGTIVSSVRNTDLAAFYFLGGKIIRTIDGGYALNGLDNTKFGGGEYNGLLLKLDCNFSKQWTVNLGTFWPS